MSWTREDVPPQRDTGQGCFSTLIAFAGRDLDDVLVGMPMRLVLLKQRLPTGRGMEGVWGVVVLDEGGRTSATRERPGMF